MKKILFSFILLSITFVEVLAQKIKDRILENFQEVNHFCLEIQKQKPAVGLIDGNSLIKLEVEL